MHRCSYILRRKGHVFNRQVTEELERIGIIFTRNLTIYRSLKKENSENTENSSSKSIITENAAEEKEGPSKRNKEAKAKLEDLLKSIVQEQKASENRNSVTTGIDMKLAAPKKEKRENQQKKVEDTDTEAKNELGVEMVSAVKKVAESIDVDAQVVESELIQKLKTQGVGKKINLSDLFAGMKIDRSSKPPSHSTGDLELSRAHRVRRLLDERANESKKVKDAPGMSQIARQRRVQLSKPTYVPIDLFGAPPLGIFHVRSFAETNEQPKPMPKMSKLETWDHLTARDLKLSVTHPPANGFEEMILWTEQGKLWKFPIDNEQGFDEEATVPFHEHVFLEPLIDGWCPNKGPIRHFMELVCIGLSKNPFITVQEKRKQIEWYHQYFKEKSLIIKDVGAGEIN